MSNSQYSCAVKSLCVGKVCRSVRAEMDVGHVSTRCRGFGTLKHLEVEAIDNDCDLTGTQKYSTYLNKCMNYCMLTVDANLWMCF